MPAYVTRPAVALPEHRITTREILADIRDRLDGLPTDQQASTGRAWRTAQGVIGNCGVDARHWMLPLADTVAPSGVADRAITAFGHARRHAALAAREALATAGVDAGSVDCVITSHTSSWTVPGLDVALIRDLGLRLDATRIPMATLACAGGAQALIRAVHHLRAHPDAVVLVVVAEQLSTIYHRDEATTESLIYKALFGDSAAAAVVTSRRLGPGMAIEATFEHLLPEDTTGLPDHQITDRYWGRIDAAGLHFDSTRKLAQRAAGEAMPHVREWLDGRTVDWAVIHPGGPGIIADVANGLGLDPDKAGRHSTASLRNVGNLGGAAIFDVLRRHHGDPPAVGTPGAAVAFGPGFATAALYGRWA